MKFYLITAALAALLTFGAGGYWYVSNMQRTVAELTSELAIAEINRRALIGAVDQQKRAIEAVAKDNRLKDEVIAEVIAKFDSTREMVRAAEDRLNASNIGTLAGTDPTAVEALINALTKNLSRCIEVASGSPLTPQDSTGNPECPELIPTRGPKTP
jgi:predicted subunit of tRNA(5-methylaminomethyl-2-thiouridylate) methyltransferase